MIDDRPLYYNQVECGSCHLLAISRGHTRSTTVTYRAVRAHLTRLPASGSRPLPITVLYTTPLNGAG